MSLPQTPSPAVSSDGPAAPTLAEVVGALEGLYPPGTSESWDAVGLVAGDPAQRVRRILLAVDPVDAVLDEAVAWGADLLLTHHPLLLRPVHSVAATTFKGALVHRAIREGVALFVAHTNADVARGGVADALAQAVGLVDCRPMVPLADAGAGSSDATAGTGTTGTGTVGTGTVGTGRVGRLDPPLTLRDFAERVAAALPETAQGVRVAGDLDARVVRVAVVGGSGDSLFDAVRATGADVYLTADLRHHPASELRERAEHEALSAGLAPSEARPFLVDVAHFASEWPWLEHAARDIAQALGNGTVELRVSTRSTDPWTARVASPDAER